MRAGRKMQVLATFLAGLLFGSGLALIVFLPGAEVRPAAGSLLAIGTVLQAAVMLARRWRVAACRTDADRNDPARPTPGGVDEVVAVVAALEALRRGSIAQGGGS